MIFRAVVILACGAWVLSRLTDPSIVGARAWSIAFFGAGLVVISIIDALGSIFRQARRYLEDLERYELEHPKEKPDPEEKVGIVKYQFKVDAEQWVYAILPNVAPEKMKALADGLLSGVPFSYRAWIKEISNFPIIQDEFAARGLARQRVAGVPQQGYDLTRDGWEAMRDIKNGTAKMIVLPSPS